MRIQKETELLEPKTLAALVKEIEGVANKTRKFNSYRRYQCYKDKTHHYVYDMLLRQFDQGTVDQMRYSLSNISIVKKVIDKLARVYSSGVERSIKDDQASTEKLNKICKALDLDSNLKKTNRYVKLEKNVSLFVKPCPVVDGSKEQWGIKIEPLLPHLYDAVEDYYDRTKPMAIILSDYEPPYTKLAEADFNRGPVPLVTPNLEAQVANGTDEKIADAAADQKSYDVEKTYVLWSKNYHFTFKANGEIVADLGNPRNENPLKVFNHINFAVDQDGSYWAEGGEDLVDGAILINSLVTHTMHVGITQGYGQFYMTGEGLPKTIKVGPTNAIIAEYKKDEQAEPKMGFLSANPQLDSLRSLIEMYIALYLTTNNLSTSGVATQLGNGGDAASGIALIIDKSESLEDVQDQRQLFLDKEPSIFEAINMVLKTYQGNLVDNLKDLILPDGFKDKLLIKFNDQQPIISEKEKLEVMKLRKDLGIDSLISLLMKDDTSLSEKDAEAKLMKLVEQNIKERVETESAMSAAGLEYVDPNAPPEETDPEAEDDEDPEEDEEKVAPNEGD